jgi:hypothetical protein
LMAAMLVVPEGGKIRVIGCPVAYPRRRT